MLGFTAELPGTRGIPASSVLGERLSGSRSVQDGCARCQCISGLATHGGSGSRFMKSPGRSQLLLAKSCLDQAGVQLPRTGQSSCLGVCGQMVIRNRQAKHTPSWDTALARAWAGSDRSVAGCGAA